jgi:hypothetical protein
LRGRLGTKADAGGASSVSQKSSLVFVKRLVTRLQNGLFDPVLGMSQAQAPQRIILPQRFLRVVSSLMNGSIPLPRIRRSSR